MKKTKLTVRHRGPLIVEGDFEIYGSDGNLIDVRGVTKIRICRCGYSKRPPLCDNTHYKTSFEADGGSADGKSADGDNPDDA